MNSHIFSVISQETLHDILTSFSECTDMPVQVLDADGSVVEKAGNFPIFCKHFETYVCAPRIGVCDSMHLSAGKKAFELGEPYIFSCHANLNHIVYPIISKSTLFGSILAGPFIMDDPDTLLLLDMVKQNSITPEHFLQLYDSIKEVRIVPPAKVTHLSRLLYYLFSTATEDTRMRLMINQSKMYQQSRINESIQKYKVDGDFTESDALYPYEKEKQLLTKVKTGNTTEAKAILNELLGYTLFAEGNSLANIRPRALELTSLLSRAAIEGGAPTNSILKINNEFLQYIQGDLNIDDLCYHLQEIIEVFTDSLFNKPISKSSDVIKSAISYISENFASSITLENVAGHVGLNPSYFSTYFKQVCGSSFKEYLNMVRIEEAKRLLANTDYSILDIAVSIGFDNQSYFSKVFKKYTGLTPRQYR